MSSEENNNIEVFIATKPTCNFIKSILYLSLNYVRETGQLKDSHYMFDYLVKKEIIFPSVEEKKEEVEKAKEVWTKNFKYLYESGQITEEGYNYNIDQLINNKCAQAINEAKHNVFLKYIKHINFEEVKKLMDADTF